VSDEEWALVAPYLILQRELGHLERVVNFKPVFRQRSLTSV
jgi:hypothetical protein